MPAFLATALLTALLYPLATAVTVPGCGGHWQGTDPMRPCYDHHLPGPGPGTLEQLLTATAGHHCYRPTDWPSGRTPAWAVMRLPDGRIVGEPFPRAWADAAHGRAWTLSLCT